MREFSESQRFVRHMIAVSPSLMCIYDVQQRKSVFINRSLAAELGYPSLQTPLVEFLKSVVHPADWQPLLDYLERLSQVTDDQIVEFEYRVRHSSGAWRWFQTREKVFTRDQDGRVRETM